MYEVFESLLIKHGITAYKVSKDTGIATSTLSDWKNGRSIPKNDKMQLIADYFGVSLDYLLTGKEPLDKKEMFMDKDDISIDINLLIDKLKNKPGTINYKGKDIPKEEQDFFLKQLRIMLEYFKRLK